MLPSYIRSRLLFPSGEQKKYIESVFEKSGLDAKSLSKIVGVSPRTIRNWKREELNISIKAVDDFYKSFNIPPPNNVDELKNNWLAKKLGVCRKGAFARYKKCGNFGTLEGSRKGGSKTLKILRDRGILPRSKIYTIPNEKSINLAEFVGIMLGDGGITKEQASITLNSEADKQYLGYVFKLSKRLFDNVPTLIKKKDCKAYDLRFSGIKLIDYFVSIGLKRGNKVKQQVGVPGWVQRSDSYKVACLRGLMDTDGCIAKCAHKYKSRKYIYFNPCFANRSQPLLNFVTNTLIDLGLHPCVAGERIWLYNKAEVRAYFELVGSSNQRLFKFRKEESHSWPSARVR